MQRIRPLATETPRHRERRTLREQHSLQLRPARSCSSIKENEKLAGVAMRFIEARAVAGSVTLCLCGMRAGALKSTSRYALRAMPIRAKKIPPFGGIFSATQVMLEGVLQLELQRVVRRHVGRRELLERREVEHRLRSTHELEWLAGRRLHPTPARNKRRAVAAAEKL